MFRVFESLQTRRRKRNPHTLTGPANAAVVSAEGNGLLLLANVLEVLDGAGKLHAVDSTGSLEGVLERDTTDEPVLAYLDSFFVL